LLTAYSDAELVRRAAKAGVYAYLVKPFRASDLLPAIETAIARFEEAQALREETASLADALAARKAIERAKGLLMEREGLTEAECVRAASRASQISGQAAEGDRGSGRRRPELESGHVHGDARVSLALPRNTPRVGGTSS